jgi:hypothetical protein
MAGKKKPRPANTLAGKVYKAENRWLKNKLRKMKIRLKEEPNNLALEKRIQEIEKVGATYSRNRVPKHHTWKPEDIRFAEWEAKAKRQAKHYIKYGEEGKPTPLPKWKEELATLRSKPKIHVKRRGHRRVRT